MMATTRNPTRSDIPETPGVEQTNAGAYQRALSLGMGKDAAVLAASHPEYLRYFRFVHPMDFRVAFSRFVDKGEDLNAVLAGMGYDVVGIEEPDRPDREKDEEIRPRMNW